MSLDVYLTVNEPVPNGGSGIFMRKDGSSQKISRKEWDDLYPGREPVVVEQSLTTNTVYSANITHNLGQMAAEAGIYVCLWRPEEHDLKRGADLVVPLERGLKILRADPERFKGFNPENGWGSYEGLVQFVEAYLDACRAYPDADVRACQ
ncbi:hypothetical protein [Roseicella sp. DB1501]|uniref:hypothetical protein n=1 Tax=Roseicella sp. DB1501 TaxID=2730925 RepID=UPI00149287D4|nr:hypothetical protein [Roseicella sp. DB1501]NOG70457.1 hypothetical protein [Roseicella sp. DB1501]